MERNNVNDYEQLLAELNNKYFEKVCDIFDTAKSELVNKLKETLGEEYAVLDKEIKLLKQSALDLRAQFDNEPFMVDLKEKLETAKSEFVEAKDDETRSIKKAELNAVLSEIAKKNLEVFSKMAELRKQIDAKCSVATDLIKEKEKDFTLMEKQVIGNARKRTLELAVSYKSEVSALSYAFDVKNYSDEMPFLKSFDPNMKLMDFNKEAFMNAFLNKNQTCGSCAGNCKACQGIDESKNHFTSESKGEFKN